MSSEIIKFQGDAIEAVREGGDVWVSVSRVSDALGLAGRVQRRKLATKEWATCRTMMVQQHGEAQSRDVFMLHLDSLPMWLATIEPSRVKPEVRGKLARYQIECARVLRDHFFNRQPEAPHVDSRGIVRNSPAARMELQNLIRHAAKQQGVKFASIEGEIRNEHDVRGYLSLPLRDVESIKRRLWRYVSGELAFSPARRRKLLAAKSTDPRQQEIKYSN